MRHKTIVMGTTFSQPTFKKRAMTIISPFINEPFVQQLVCVNYDPQRRDPGDCSVVLYSKSHQFLALKDCSGEEAHQPQNILQLSDADEVFHTDVDADSIFLHQF